MRFYVLCATMLMDDIMYLRTSVYVYAMILMMMFSLYTIWMLSIWMMMRKLFKMFGFKREKGNHIRLPFSLCNSFWLLL